MYTPQHSIPVQTHTHSHTRTHTLSLTHTHTHTHTHTRLSWVVKHLHNCGWSQTSFSLQRKTHKKVALQMPERLFNPTRSVLPWNLGPQRSRQISARKLCRSFPLDRLGLSMSSPSAHRKVTSLHACFTVVASCTPRALRHSRYVTPRVPAPINSHSSRRITHDAPVRGRRARRFRCDRGPSSARGSAYRSNETTYGEASFCLR